MGLHCSQLRQCHKHVKAVGGYVLIWKGWIPATFKIDVYITTQPLYICEKVDRLHFSKQGCLAVNILSHNYPHPMPKPAIQSLQTNRAPPVISPIVHLHHDLISCLTLPYQKTSQSWRITFGKSLPIVYSTMMPHSQH